MRNYKVGYNKENIIWLDNKISIGQKDPDHFALRQYKKYKLAAGVVCSKRLLNQAVGKSQMCIRDSRIAPAH